MEKQGRERWAAMLRRDLLLLVLCGAALLLVNGFILARALPLLPGKRAWVLALPFGAAMAAMLGTLGKIGLHLCRSRDALYQEETRWLKRTEGEEGEQE